MLLASFQHLPGISERGERELWRKGILSWDALQARLDPQLHFFSLRSRSRYEDIIQLSRKAIENSNIEFFAEYLPRREHYRIALTFPSDTLFLDIETTGLSKHYDEITLIGWSLGANYNLYLKGSDEGSFRKALREAKVIVTFNGSLFDLPFLRKEFPNLSLPIVHVDLRFLCRRVGLTGGQKAIETTLGFVRAKEIDKLSGKEAPLLWYKYSRGDLSALRHLIIYNHADIEGMKRVFDIVVNKLARQQGFHKVRRHVSFSSLSTTIKSIERMIKHNSDRILIRKRQRKKEARIRLKDLIQSTTLTPIRIVGIDLSGSESRASGWCLLECDRATTLRLHTDEEIISQVLKVNPHLISIDSPLSLPKGRVKVTDDDPGRREFGIMRICERILKQRGVSVYPSLIPSMQNLTARGIRLATTFRRIGIPVIESYPGAAQDIMRIPRKRASLELLRMGLKEFGVYGDWSEREITHDELDAITSALVGLFFWSGRFEALGNEDEDYLIVPDLKAESMHWISRRVVGISGPIAAGKTTAAEFLSGKDYYYQRFSLLLSAMLGEKDVEPTRENLQQIGDVIHRTPGQRWLCVQLARSLPSQGNIAIDGLRYPEDHAYFVEQYGPAFLHVHIDAPYQTRLERYRKLGYSERDFETASKHAVEHDVEKLASLSHIKINNSCDIDSFLSNVDYQVRCPKES